MKRIVSSAVAAYADLIEFECAMNGSHRLSPEKQTMLLDSWERMIQRTNAILTRAGLTFFHVADEASAEAEKRRHDRKRLFALRQREATAEREIEMMALQG